MKKEELAAQLNGRKYGSEISKPEAAAAKDAGLVVVFGASDDLMEFRGAVHGEVGFPSAVAIDGDGVIQRPDEEADDATLERYLRRKKSAKPIHAEWCGATGIPWVYSTEIEHATFDIVEDGETYCRGIVFSLCDALLTNNDKTPLLLARRWETEAMQVLANIEAGCFRSEVECEMARAAHGYVLHCAGELLDILGEPRTLDEKAERIKVLAAIRVARSDA